MEARKLYSLAIPGTLPAPARIPVRMDEKEFKARLKAYDERQAARRVEGFIADTAHDAAEASKPPKSSLTQFIACDNLRVSIENLRESSAVLDNLNPNSALAEKANQAEDKALSSVSPTCRAQIDRALDLDKQQPFRPGPPRLPMT